ncbi:hypothetical protein OESDEN_21676 [Oesophagostomum dentatum]|uniref:Uncharacterized protein n=1 Tax=Oesophagostomum dentatum TaxID=61180 RepID=A0A0B1S4A5_OESDE|nr:hypothetical protein OESDEN_21676 [Oesophagostomum dentatum]
MIEPTSSHGWPAPKCIPSDCHTPCEMVCSGKKSCIWIRDGKKPCPKPDCRIVSTSPYPPVDDPPP